MQIQEERSVFYRPKWELKVKGQPHPMRRWCHTAIIYMSDLFIFGGRFPDSAKTKELAYKVNCQTFVCQQINFFEGLSFRQSHSCSLINDSMFVLFGVEKQKVLNDCLQFKITSNSLIWEKKPQKPQIEGRESHLSAVLSGKYILIYGGVNQQEKLLTDFYLFNTQDFTWRKIQKIKGNLEIKVGGSLTIINNQIYIFGGQINDQNQYSNQIYKIKIFNLEQKENSQTQIQIFKLIINGVKPLPRTCHAATSYKERYMIILGGQTQPKPPSELSTLLNDVWFFDIEKNQWEQLKIQNSNLFKPRSNFTATIYKDNLLVFGGLLSTKDYRSSDEIFCLFLNTGENRLTCNICKTTYKQIQKSPKQIKKEEAVLSEHKFMTGISNIFKVSSSIKHPFQCFGLILYSMELLSIQKCIICLQENLIFKIQNFELSDCEWNHIRSIYQFNPLFISNDKRLDNALRSEIRRNHINFFAYNLKNICLRLGNSFLISWTNGQNIKIVLVNKFGVFQTIDPEWQKQKKASHTSIILQYIKQEKINLFQLFKYSFNVYVSSLKQIKQKNEISYHENDITTWKQQMLKPYLQTYFDNNLIMKIELNRKQYYIPKTKYQKTPIQPIQGEKFYFFQKVNFFQSFQASFLTLYQHGRLLHKTKSNLKVSYDFHLIKQIQANITFTDIDPSPQIIQEMKKICNQNEELIKKRKQPSKGFDQYSDIFNGKSQKTKQSKNETSSQKNQMDIQKDQKLEP